MEGKVKRRQHGDDEARITFILPRVLWERVTEEGERRHVAKSVLLRWAIDEWLRVNEGKYTLGEQEEAS